MSATCHWNCVARMTINLCSYHCTLSVMVTGLTIATFGPWDPYSCCWNISQLFLYPFVTCSRVPDHIINMCISLAQVRSKKLEAEKSSDPRCSEPTVKPLVIRIHMLACSMKAGRVFRCCLVKKKAKTLQHISIVLVSVSDLFHYYVHFNSF